MPARDERSLINMSTHSFYSKKETLSRGNKKALLRRGGLYLVLLDSGMEAIGQAIG